MKDKDGGPAFPTEEYKIVRGPHYGSSYDNGHVGLEQKTKHPGMTLRQWYAGKALGAVIEGGATWDGQKISERAFAIADAMIAEGSK